MRWAAWLLTATLTIVCGPARADDPDLVELGRKAIVAEKANSDKAQQYAFREYKVTRNVDRNGKETSRQSETWDIIGLEGSTYRKLVMRNDQPLEPKEQKREDDRLRKETELRRKETPEERRRRLLSFSYNLSFPFDKLTEIYDLRYGGREFVEGNSAHVIEGTPKADFRPVTADEKETVNYTVKLWLTDPAASVCRMELEVTGDHSRMQKGSLILWEFAPHEDGVWLPTTLSFRFNARFFKMLSVRGEMTQAYSDYHKFQVDSRIVDTTDK